MFTGKLLIVLGLAVAWCAGCTTLPDNQSILESIRFIGALRDAGQLPGVTKEDRGEFSTKPDPVDSNSPYPVSVTVYLTLPVKKTKYDYRLQKGSKYGPWIMTEAWGYDKTGQKRSLTVPDVDAQLEANRTDSPVVLGHGR